MAIGAAGVLTSRSSSQIEFYDAGLNAKLISSVGQFSRKQLERSNQGRNIKRANLLILQGEASPKPFV